MYFVRLSLLGPNTTPYLGDVVSTDVLKVEIGRVRWPRSQRRARYTISTLNEGNCRIRSTLKPFLGCDYLSLASASASCNMPLLRE